MIGARNERLEVIDVFFKEDKRGKKVKYFLCKCDCGNEKLVRSDGITSKRIKSCGCLAKELASQKAKEMGLNNKKHGMSRSRIYKIWDNMRERCNNPNHTRYEEYGGRGITYDPKWDSFSNFYEDMKEGYSDDLTIERIDVNDNYYKENCTWLTMTDRQANKQNTDFLILNGESKRLVEWADILNIPAQTLRSRKRRDWNDFDTLTKPVRKYL